MILAEAKRPLRPYPANGFHALSFFDRVENGGNGDGKIDASDKVFSSLRVWVDSCLTAYSPCGKMYTLPEVGIESISLKYPESSRTDQYGNQLPYVGSVKMGRKAPHCGQDLRRVL